VIVLRIIAWLLLAGAVFAAGLDGLAYLETGEYAPLPLGQVWATIHRGSLLLVEPGIVRHLHPALWEDVVFPLLQAPAWLVATVSGGILGILARERTPRRRRRPEWR
jgi:hypothetical protein